MKVRDLLDGDRFKTGNHKFARVLHRELNGNLMISNEDTLDCRGMVPEHWLDYEAELVDDFDCLKHLISECGDAV